MVKKKRSNQLELQQHWCPKKDERLFSTDTTELRPLTIRWDSTTLIRPVAVAQPFISNPSSIHQPKFLKLWNNSLTSPARVMCCQGRKSKILEEQRHSLLYTWGSRVRTAFQTPWTSSQQENARRTLKRRTDSVFLWGQKPMQGTITHCGVRSYHRLRKWDWEKPRTTCLLFWNTAPLYISAGSPVERSAPGLVWTARDEEGEVWCTSKHLLFNDVGGLIVEDGLQAVGVSWCLWVQGEGQGHVNGGKFIPEFFLILH